MDVFMQFIGSAGYPTSFVAAAVFFIFWHQKMLRGVNENKDKEMVRLLEQNKELREENIDLEKQLSKSNEELYRAQIYIDISQGKFPIGERETKDGQGQDNKS